MTTARDIMLTDIAEAVAKDKPLNITDAEADMFDTIGDIQDNLEEMIARIKDEIPSSRERSLVITKLQEASLWLDEVPLS